MLNRARKIKLSSETQLKMNLSKYVKHEPLYGFDYVRVEHLKNAINEICEKMHCNWRTEVIKEVMGEKIIK